MNAFTRLFDAFAAPLFKTDAQGTRIYYPIGIWGAGYELPDAATAERTRRTVRYAFMAYFMIGLPLLLSWFEPATLKDWGILVVVAVLAALAFNAWLSWLARGLPKSASPLTWQEASRAHLNTLGRGWSLIVTLVLLMFAALGVAVVLIDKNQEHWEGPAIIAFAIALLVLQFMQWRMAKRDRKRDRM